MPELRVRSEIGRLKRVVLHTPGPEVEAMTPREAADDLYNDIIPLGAVRAEYDVLKAFLESVAEVSELVDLLSQTLEGSGNKFEFLTALSGLCPIRSRIEELMAMPSSELARRVIEGLPSAPGSLAALAQQRSFAMRPLPNAYFMRDSAAVVRDCLVSGATAFDVRLIESIVTRFVFTHHPDFLARSLLIDGPRERNRFISIEGGDILVLSPRTLAVGVSERTSADAVERLALEAGAAFGETMTVFAVLLPKERFCIHLDMVFTMVDRDAALVYAPLITGPRRARVLRIEAARKDRPRITEEESLFQGLRGAGIDLEPIACGGGDPLYQDREQWWSGANSFAFAPGRILMYSCNARSLDALSAAGFEVKKARDLLADKPDGSREGKDRGRLVVTFDGIELARGGGGARCMTLPVEREDL